MLEKFNYEHNCTVGLKDNETVNGQGLGEVAKMKYGFFNMSYNGCEMIAIHNSMVLLGRGSSLKEVCREMYPKCQALHGLFGSNPVALGSYYRNRKIPYRKTYGYDDFFDSLPDCKVAVLSFWNPPTKPWNGIHTVTVQYVDGRIRIYNRTNRTDHPMEYENRYDVMPNKTNFICGYLIEERR